MPGAGMLSWALLGAGLATASRPPPQHDLSIPPRPELSLATVSQEVAGRAELSWPDGSTYNGGWQGGKPEGNGTQVLILRESPRNRPQF